VLILASIKGWKFPVQVDKSTGRIMTVEDNENVKQSVNIILRTEQYERKIFPTFGTDMRAYMFEVVDQTFISMIKSTVTGSLKRWESHIKDLHVSVRAAAGPICKVETIVDYLTDIAPVQERVSKTMDMSGIK
jgi:phage baseplate assembly protein W